MERSIHPAGIQMIGTQRSGSNLLRVILDQSPELVSPHPAHVLVTFVPLIHLYEPMTADTYKLLIKDVVDYVRVNPVLWDGIELNENWIFENSKRQTIFEINKLIYECAARSKKAKYWCCKSMANVHYATELEAHSPELKYIYLFRDGRDVALSFKKAIVGEKHIYHLAKQWYKDQMACINLAKRMDKDRFFALNYEGLISNPAEVIQKLCAFLEIDYSEKMLDFYRSKESIATANAGEMWENLTKPIIQDNTGKYRKELTEEEINLFEQINYNVLTQLGYPVNHQNKKNVLLLLSPTEIETFNGENDSLKKQIMAKARQSDIDNRIPQLDKLKEITGRTLPINID